MDPFDEIFGGTKPPNSQINSPFIEGSFSNLTIKENKNSSVDFKL